MNWSTRILEKIFEFINWIIETDNQINTKSNGKKNTDNIDAMKVRLNAIKNNEKSRSYLNSLGKEIVYEKDSEYYGAPYKKITCSSYPKVNDIFDKIDKLKESSFGQCAIAYEDEIVQLVLTLSSHRKDGEIEIFPENLESFLKTVSNIYDILCHKEKEVKAEEERERLKWVEFGEEASNKVNRTMEGIKEELDVRPRVNLDKKNEKSMKDYHMEAKKSLIKANCIDQYQGTDILQLPIFDKNKNTYIQFLNDKIVYMKCVFNGNGWIERSEQTIVDIPYIYRWEANRYMELLRNKDSLTVVGDCVSVSNTSMMTYHSVHGELGLLRSLDEVIENLRLKPFSNVISNKNDWTVESDIYMLPSRIN